MPQGFIQSEQVASFLEIKSVAVKKVLSGSEILSDNHVQFHDPWYVDTTGSQPDDFLAFSSPYYPTGNANENTGGVFLDQGWPGWQPPYYSVKAVEKDTFTAHGQDITG